MTKVPVAIIAAGDVLGEGPVWDDLTGRLIWTDIQSSVVRRYEPSSDRLEVFAAPERVGSMALLPAQSDRVIAAFETGVAAFHLPSGAVEWLHRPEQEANGRRFNDGRVDRHGHFWVGTMVEDPVRRSRAEAAVWRLGADGDMAVRRPNVMISNGLCFSPDGRTLYFSDSPLQRMWAYDHDPETGRIFNERVLAEVAEGYPDGAVVDAEGCIWSARWGAGQIVRHAPDGRVIDRLAVPASQPTCMAFGGPDLRTLYVTSARDELGEDELAAQPHAGDVFVFELPVPGLPEPRYTGASH